MDDVRGSGAALCAGSCALALLLLAPGCATTREDREDAAREMQDRLVRETADYFAANPGPLAFSNALALARERSLKLTEHELDVQLAKVTRAAAFSTFLPNVEILYGRALASGRLSGVLPATLRSSGLDFENAGLVVSQPVFTPVAWTVFAETLYGVRIREHVHARARQLLDVQVAVKFHDAAVAAQLVRARTAQVAGGVALTNRLAHLAAEGLATSAEKARADARLAADEYGLLAARHEQEKARQALADILRLWPLAPFEVDGESLWGEERGKKEEGNSEDVEAACFRPPVSPVSHVPHAPKAKEMGNGEWGMGNPSLEELVWQALLNRRDLRAADETLALRKAQVVEALAGFLPNVVLGGGGASVTLESAALRGWAGSLAGVWSVFGGFRTVQEYRAARAMREAEFRLNEDRMLAVVLSVADCWRNLRAARAAASVAAKGAAAAALDHDEAARRLDGGRETASSVLDKAAARDEAEVVSVRARGAVALAEIMLRQAVGGDIAADALKRQPCP